MERAELKQYLKEIGVKEELTEMPAVVEPIYEKYKDKTIDEIKWEIVSFAGNIEYDEIKVRPEVNGGAKIKTKSGKITHINEYGIETKKEWGDQMDDETFYARELGEVQYHRTAFSVAMEYFSTVLDTGHWGLQETLKDEEAVFLKRTVDDFQMDLEEVDLDKVLEVFDKNSEEVMMNYPKTIEWYTKVRATIVERVCKAKIEKLEEKNRELLDSNEKMTEMLGKTLRFAEKVKLNPVGKMFFSKGLKEMDKEFNTIDAPGREEK